MALDGSARRAAGRAHGARAQGASRSARSARRSRWRPTRRPGPGTQTAIDGSCWPATGSRPALPATIESAVISGHRAACAAEGRESRRFHDVDPRLTTRSRAQGQEPLVVRRPAGAQHPRRRSPACTSRKCGRRSAASRSCSGRTSALPEVRDRLSRVFGIANYSVADARCRSTSKAWPTRWWRSCRRAKPPQSFRVLVRRADPKFPTPSPDLARDLGSRVWTARGWKVDLDHADLVISVEIIPGAAFCYIGREAGPGGLPTGTGGPAASRCLSGGIDSPVAAWRMMKRGCHVTLVHFHSAPFLSNASQEKARRLAEVLTRYQLRSRLYLVPFGELQRQITLSVPGRSARHHLSAADAAHRAADRASTSGPARWSPAT